MTDSIRLGHAHPERPLTAQPLPRLTRGGVGRFPVGELDLDPDEPRPYMTQRTKI